MKTLEVLLLVTMSTVAFTQSTPTTITQPFAIVISTSKVEVKAGDPVEIKIHLTNVSDQELDMSTSWERSLDVSYDYSIVDASGKQVNEVAHEGPSIGHIKNRSLRPGESVDETTLLSDAYNMSHLGKYVVQVSRTIADAPNNRPVRSNKITITVIP